MKRKSRTHKSYSKQTKKNKNKKHQRVKSSFALRYDKTSGKTLGKTSRKASRKTSVNRSWSRRKKILSTYPYIITISYYRTNIFFNAADIEGYTKAWTNAGRSGFKNKDKTTYMAIVLVTQFFLKKIWSWGIRQMILIFRNFSRKRVRFGVRFGLRRRRYRFKYLGFVVQNQMAFNGCRRKKKRRK